MADRASPSTPSPAATGIARASRPIRIRSVMPSISVAPFANLTILQVADFVFNLLFGGTCADQLRHAAQVAGCADPKRLNEQQHADHDEYREPGDPQRLRDDGR